MKVRHPLAVLHSFLIKNVFMLDRLQVFLFSCADMLTLPDLH